MDKGPVCEARDDDPEGQPWDPRQRRREAVGSLTGGKPEGRLVWKDSCDGPYLIECRRQRFWKADERFIFKSRDIEWRLLSEHGVCAAAKFVEWRGSPEGGIDEFVSEADALSQADYDMAEAIRRSWQWYQFPFDYGTVIRFDRLAIDTLKDSQRLAWRYLSRALDHEFGIRGAVILLKAFPLEYESEVNNDRRVRFDRRSAAMTRLYRSRLGARPLPNDWGEKGWMWIPLRSSIEPGDVGDGPPDAIGSVVKNPQPLALVGVFCGFKYSISQGFGTLGRKGLRFGRTSWFEVFGVCEV